MEVSGFFAAPEDYDLRNDSLTLLHSSDGGFFELYRGERAGLFRVYKCLKPEYRGSLLHETMLRKEFEIGYPLRSPFIRETFAYSRLDALGNCVEMEWVDGCPLDEYIRKFNPDKARVREIAADICDAVGYLHSKQVVHRDLKPSNILITHQGRHVKLIDFSLSDSDSHTLFKVPAGTRSYTAPEVLAGEIPGQPSDIWSLAKVLTDLPGIPRTRAIACSLSKEPSVRCPGAESIKASLQRRHRPAQWLSGLALAMAIAAVLVAAMTIRQRGSSDMGERPAERDTVYIMQGAPSATQAPAHSKPPETEATDKESPVLSSEIDDIFRQASELFD